jgi:hypothetical protein
MGRRSQCLETQTLRRCRVWVLRHNRKASLESLRWLTRRLPISFHVLQHQLDDQRRKALVELAVLQGCEINPPHRQPRNVCLHEEACEARWEGDLPQVGTTLLFRSNEKLQTSVWSKLTIHQCYPETHIIASWHNATAGGILEAQRNAVDQAERDDAASNIIDNQ